MPIAVGGANHKSSPLWLREKAALSTIRLFDTRKRLFELDDIDELVVISTCNRVEFYVAGPDRDKLVPALGGFLMSEYCIRDDELNEYFYFASGEEAVERLFLVAAGADSMVLGECQVSGQVQRAFDQAREEGTLGHELERLSRSVDEVTKRIEAETDFGAGQVSIGSVAVEMARDQLGSLKNRAAIILGAGDMGIITARALSAHGVATILVANRTLSRAQEVAHSLGGKAVDYTELSSQIEKVDVLVASTSAPHVLIRKAMIERVMSKRPNRPLFIVDLAVPRNVDAAAGEVGNVTLMNVDDLQDVSDNNSKERVSELGLVKDVVKEEARRFLAGDKKPGMSLTDLAMG